ncbi:MAG: Gfo/Idh/MocA family oxidoreductase [Deltaproteobacteria bacterium]|nr:Gfo/Idh/MocA family oxidoreductase [Deltaproteobacteria bacterium]
MPKPFRTVLVGAGKMGRNHLRVLGEDARFRVAAVVDPQVEKLLPGETSFRKATSLAELDAGDWDCAVVAVPTPAHAGCARELLERGRPLLVEKPLASTPAECAELVDMAERLGVPLAVGHLERLNPAVRKLAELLDGGWLGLPVHLSFTRVGGYPEAIEPGNNVLIDLAVHDLDVLRTLTGGVKVEASVCHSAWRTGVLDTAVNLLSTAGEPNASIHANWVTPAKIRTLRVTGTRGVCFVDYILQSCSMLGGNMLRRHFAGHYDFNSLLEEYRSTDRLELGVVKQEPLKIQLGELYRLLTGEKNALCTAREGAAAVALADEALRRAVQTVHEKAVGC